MNKAKSMRLPEVVADLNVYSEGNTFLGMSGELQLPTLDPQTETISGLGIAGEIETCVPGQFGSIAMDFPFRTLSDANFRLMVPGSKTLIIRGAVKYHNLETGMDEYGGLKVMVKGSPKGTDIGKLSPGKPTESKNTLELTYIKIELDGVEMLELDKLNSIYRVYGEDARSGINKFI